MSKRGRGYTNSAEDRSASTTEFLTSLRFSRPLKDLRSQTERLPCPKCGKKRQYYCYDCLAVCNPATHPPPLRLPVAVHVVLHPGETRGKSTTLPIATVSPDVSIHVYPTVPDLDPATTLVLYPSASSVEIEEVTDIANIKAFVFVDSTWQQSKCIAGDERVKRFRHVKLSGIISLFWRFQDKDPYHLATVEAIYHSLRNLVIARNRQHLLQIAFAAAPVKLAPSGTTSSGEAAAPSAAPSAVESSALYSGEVDDLLYYYVNQYIAVQQNYSGPDREFTGKHFDGYVLKGIDWDALLEQRRRPQPPAPAEQKEEADAAAAA